jgi:GTP-binding protein LepA
VINKIDLASARPDEVAEEVEALVGTPAASILRVSAKEGINVDKVLDAIVEQIPPPIGNVDAPLQALIFDSHYDSYKGVVAYIRVVSGSINMNSTLRLMATNSDLKPVEVGVFAPGMVPTGVLNAGDVGYIATGFKSVKDAAWAIPYPGYQSRIQSLAGIATRSLWYLRYLSVEGEDYEH